MKIILLQDNVLQIVPEGISEALQVMRILKELLTQYAVVNNSIFVEKEAYDNLVKKNVAKEYMPTKEIQDLLK